MVPVHTTTMPDLSCQVGQPRECHNAADGMQLKRWFFTRTLHARGPIRVWGYAPDGRLWRSSSVTQATQPRELITRFGTHVRLLGPIDETAARAASISPEVCQRFADGLPSDWQILAESLKDPTVMVKPSQAQLNLKSRKPNLPSREPVDLKNNWNGDVPEKPSNKLIVGFAKNPSKAGRKTNQTKDKPLQPAGRRKPSRRRVEFAESPEFEKPRLKRTKSSSSTFSPVKGILVSPKAQVLVQEKNLLQANASDSILSEKISSTCTQNPPPPLRKPDVVEEVQKRTGSIRGVLDTENIAPSIASVDLNDSDPDFPGTPLLPHWTREQLDAYDKQRTTVPADVPNYWDKVADGVQGKSASECRSLWNSTWTSPAQQSRPNSKAKQAAPESTPEAASQIMGVSGAAKKTAKYKRNLRKLAAAVNRDVDDDVLEPKLGCSPEEEVRKEAQQDYPSATLSLLQRDLKRGTPDTAAKSKRAAAEKAGKSKTPEIFSRGRSFGLAQADQYLSVFHRRIHAAVNHQNSTAQSKKAASKSTQGQNGKSKVGATSGSKSIPQSAPQPTDDSMGEEDSASPHADEICSSDEFDLFF